jgi:uncharacterized protein YeaO (DUF488 family)
MHKIKIKRIYDSAAKDDGVRILIDRLWPRGIKKKDAQIKTWLKDIAPSNELRKLFNHEHDKWNEFKEHYIKELQDKEDLILLIKQELKSHNVTLLFSAKDDKFNNAVVLQDYLTKHLVLPKISP